MTVELSHIQDTPQRQHAIFCERQFAMELFRRIRMWRLAGKLVKR